LFCSIDTKQTLKRTKLSPSWFVADLTFAEMTGDHDFEAIYTVVIY